MQPLKTLRKRIDTIDDELIELLEARFKTCLEIGAVKKQEGSAVFNASREKEIQDKLVNSPYSSELTDLFNRIMQHCKALQRNGL